MSRHWQINGKFARGRSFGRMRLEEKNCEHIAVDHDSQFGIVTAIVSSLSDWHPPTHRNRAGQHRETVFADNEV